MKTIFAEQPLMLSFMIGTIAVALVYVWLQTGKKAIGIGGLACGLLIPVVWMIASSIETDREQIETLIRRTAQAVQDNDHATAVSVIDRLETRQQALAELPRYVFDKVSVGNMTIKIVKGSPLQADVDMIASVRASDKDGRFNDMRVARRILLTFQKGRDDQWTVVDYNHLPVTGQPDAFSPKNISGSRLNRRN